MLTRRNALRIMGSGFGMVGLSSLLNAGVNQNPLAPKEPQFPARAKRVIFLSLNGGPSQVDTFDPKPMLDKYNGQPMPGAQPINAAGHVVQVGNLMKSPFGFKKYGQSGIEVSDIFPKVGGCIDDVCVIRSMYSDIPNHPQGLFMMNCGISQAGRPSMGSWLLYGLGTANHNLPGFLVLAPGLPIMAPQIWNSAVLPASYQGSWVQNIQGDPEKLIPYIRNSRESASEQQRKLDLLGKLNRAQLRRQ